MVHIAIVEDEDRYAKQLKEYLMRYQRENECEFTVARFGDGDEIVEGYTGAYDVILMDIQMKFMDGMTAAEKIRQMDAEVIIMFITNMTEYAVRGYEVDALDYIVKPIEYFAFSRKLEKALSRMRTKRHNYISIPTASGMKKLDLEEIHYIEIQDHTLIYHTETESVRAKGRGAMKEVEQAMIPYGFCRNNNCYLVNLRWVEGVEDNICTVGNQQLQISRAKKKAFMNALVQYISEGRVNHAEYVC